VAAGEASGILPWVTLGIVPPRRQTGKRFAGSTPRLQTYSSRSWMRRGRSCYFFRTGEWAYRTASRAQLAQVGSAAVRAKGTLEQLEKCGFRIGGKEIEARNMPCLQYCRTDVQKTWISL